MARERVDFEYPRNIRFKCDRCTLCCGDTKDRLRKILLMKIEAERISQKTSMPIEHFADRVHRSEPYAYKMRKTPHGKCIFLKDSACAVYAIRPLICGFYPFELKQIEGDKHLFAFTNECPCIGKGLMLKKSYFERLFKKSERIMQENARQA